MKKTTPEKSNFHSRNKNRERYDLEAMILATPALKKFVRLNKFGVKSINFSDPKAVKILNKAILNYYYGICFWEFPDENLCPPIPGRADYIHHISDLLNAENNQKITCLDVGVGASCIYPILGVASYNWNFIGSDIDSKSVKSSQKIVESNSNLKGKIECRIQENPTHIFKGILKNNEKIDAVICNPPFHSSIEEALKGSRRKVKSLSGKHKKSPMLNFSGNTNELICKGGESQFISNIISESKAFSNQCNWFTVLVSKESTLKKVEQLLQKNNPKNIKIVEMKTGNKISRILAWSYQTKK